MAVFAHHAQQPCHLPGTGWRVQKVIDLSCKAGRPYQQREKTDGAGAGGDKPVDDANTPSART